MDKDRLNKIIAKLEDLSSHNGKIIVLLDFIRSNFSDILKDAQSPPFDQDMALATFITNEAEIVMFYLFKKDLIEVSKFVNSKTMSKKFKTTEVSEVKEFLLNTVH